MLLVLLLAGLVSALPLHGQKAPPEFEVATVRRSPPPLQDTININLGTASNGRVALTNATLSDCLKFAYGIQGDAQLAGPEWIRSGELRYDVVAQAPRETSREDLLLMLQALLADRMKVVHHSEQRELPYLALTPGKNSLKLMRSKEDAAQGGPSFGGRIVSPRMSMLTLATLLSRFERQTVLDQTGLTGFFGVKLEWRPDANRNSESDTRPSLVTAVQEQLGLRLESRKGPVAVLVVDRADQTPAEN